LRAGGAVLFRGGFQGFGAGGHGKVSSRTGGGGRVGGCPGERQYVGEGDGGQRFFVQCTKLSYDICAAHHYQTGDCDIMFASLTSCLLGRKVGYAMLGYDLAVEIAVL
jgi:hypothetical protein